MLNIYECYIRPRGRRQRAIEKDSLDVKFLSYDNVEKIECETEIRTATSDTVRDFSGTWEPYVDDKIIRQRDKDFNYRCFEWDRIINMSLSSVLIDKCYAAYTGARLDGCCLSGINACCTWIFLPRLRGIITAPPAECGA